MKFSVLRSSYKEKKGLVPPSSAYEVVEGSELDEIEANLRIGIRKTFDNLPDDSTKYLVKGLEININSGILCFGKFAYYEEIATRYIIEGKAMSKDLKFDGTFAYFPEKDTIYA